VPATVVRSIELFFQEGSSDKVYNARIVEDRGTYTVAVEWGRRGSTLSSGSKAVRVTLAVANRKFDSLVREKTNKGYEQITATVKPAPVAPPDGEGSGSKVGGQRARVGPGAQLLTALEDDALAGFLADDSVVAQQKVDGQRVLVHVGPTHLATNRDGQPTQIPARLLAGLDYLPHGTILDGEVVGDAYWLFDVLQLAGEDVRGRGYLDRWALLDEELEPALGDTARILPLALGKRAKQVLHDKLRHASAEGIVFKQRAAPYTSGRPASGGTQRKYKFVRSVDVVVLENAGNAYRMAVYDGRALFEIGKVFAGTTNASRKELDLRLGRGEHPVCEVRYLYATDEHQLYQPVFVTIRDDKIATACLRDQLVGTNRGVVI
jgi:bifunctional non-homologous end joining protein LigD